MTTAQFERQNHTIKELPKGKRKAYPSINAAKRRSREIQIAEDGSLGLGSVVVAE